LSVQIGTARHSSQFKNNNFTEMCSGSEAGSYLRLIDSCITQLKAQGPAISCNKSKEEEEEGLRVQGSVCRGFRVSGSGFRVPGFGFRVSGFGFRFSVFVFRVSCFGFRDYEVEADRARGRRFGGSTERSPQTVTSKVSTSASKNCTSHVREPLRVPKRFMR